MSRLRAGQQFEGFIIRIIDNQPSPAEAAKTSEYDVNHAWEGDNQDWWDWYVTLADNGGVDLDRLLPAPALPTEKTLSDEALLKELSTPYPLTEDECARFAAEGYIKLPNVLSPGAVMRLRAELVRLLGEAFQTRLDGGANNRFLSLEMVWLENPLVRAYVLSPRIAKICADLLRIPAIRLYHDNVLSKEPGCGRTPWHYDDHHFPLATQDVVTAWIPAQPIPRAMGPLAFAKPIDVYRQVADIPFNKVDTSYDQQVIERFAANQVAVDDSAFAMGEVSFHHNLSFHTAGPNLTAQSRVVLANTFYADGARVMDQPTMVSGDWQKFIPDTAPGALAASPRNPVCWPPEAPLAALSALEGTSDG